MFSQKEAKKIPRIIGMTAILKAVLKRFIYRQHKTEQSSQVFVWKLFQIENSEKQVIP